MQRGFINKTNPNNMHKICNLLNFNMETDMESDIDK